MATILNKKTLAVIILLSSLLISFSILQVWAAANDSSITLKKDPASGFFTLTVKDPDGIQEFSMTPTGKFPYGGGLSNCPKSFTANNVSFDISSDFEPVMPAYVIDCKNNTANLEIAPPKDGLAKSVPAIKEEAQPVPQPLPKEETSQEKKSGPLSADDIVYPVPGLGSCQSEADCRNYCDNSQHAKECFAFAQKYNLISEKEAEKVKEEFLEVNNGPGGCNSGVSCEAYCNNVGHLDECIAFAEKNDYYSADKLAEAKKFQQLVKSGKQFPGSCKDRNECELYCNDSRHMEECLNFAEDTGFMPKEEIDQARKILPLMQKGETPGGCTSKEQCEKYCFDESHSDECIAFGEKIGLISSEDAAMIKKTGGKGPGGCRSKEQCEAYCENNGDACFEWAQKNGFFSEADAARMNQGISQLKNQLDKMPPEVAQCLKDTVGEKNFEKLVSGQPIFDRSLEGKMKSCFSQITSQLSEQLNMLPPEAGQCIQDAIGEEGLKKLQSGEFDENIDFNSLEGCFQQLQQSFSGGSGGPGGFSGPGGCKSIEECQAYCQENSEECKGFGPQGGDRDFPGGGETGGNFPGGGATGGEFPGGPGGCRSQEECMAYCQSNPKECGGEDGGRGGDTGGGSQSCINAPAGLVSWLSGNAVSGTAVTDIANGNNGTIVGGVNIISGKAGKAFHFDGSSGYINMGNPGSLNFGTGPFSLEAWFNWNGGGSSVNNIIRKSDYPSSGPGSGYWVRIGRDTQIIEFSVGATTGPEGQSIMTAPITSGTWHHVVAIRDGSDTIKLYIDGQPKGAVLRKASGADSTSESSFGLGAWIDQYSEFFSGDIEEVSVYNRVLDVSEVQALFNAGSSGKCPVSSDLQQQYQSYEQQPTQSGGQIPQEYCSGFASVPSCSYVGAPDSQNYKYCKQCFPDK